MIDTGRQEWIRDHTQGGVTGAEVLREYNLLWPARRYMGKVVDEADELVECGWANYMEDFDEGKNEITRSLSSLD